MHPIFPRLATAIAGGYSSYWFATGSPVLGAGALALAVYLGLDLLLKDRS